jgi:hypothetical protein
MATSNSTTVIPTYTKLASGANINYIGCVDNTLPAGTGLITDNKNNKYWFGSIMNPPASWQEIKHSTNSQPVAIGHEYFAIGKEIYKFGQVEPVCMARDPVVSGTQGHHITRILENGNILEIKRHGLGRMSQYTESFAIHFQHFQIIDGELKQLPEVFTRLESMSVYFDMFYLKGYVVVHKDIDRYLLIECTNGTTIDTVYGPNIVQTRVISGGDKLGIFTHPSPVYDYDYDDFSDIYLRLDGTLDVLEGKFLHQSFDNKKRTIHPYIRKVYELNANDRFIWSDSYIVAENIMVVNFRLFCCLAADDATPAHSHPSECGLLKTKHRDSYGLIYMPTSTVIRLRDRPLFGKALSDTPKILESHMSHDKRILALVVQSSEAIRTPTKNQQIVVIDTVTGQGEIAFSVSFGTESALQADNIPEVLNLNTTAVVFKIFGQVIQQPIFQARKDIIATKLYDMARGSVPLELMRQVTAYLA